MTRRFAYLAAAATALTTIALTSPAIAQDAVEAPPLVEQINNGKWLDQAEAESLLDELFYQRAIHAYMTMLPALNVIGMRDGSEATFGTPLTSWTPSGNPRPLI